MMQLILASKSPRRREILENLGVRFEIVTADTDESTAERDPCRLVEILAARKGEAVREKMRAEGRSLSDCVILASDTVVAAESEILGKPRDRADARRMLKMLSGATHRVVSGICLIRGERIYTAHEVTEVTFDPMSEDEIEAYINAENPFDKAGAYAIQGRASAYIRGIRGCYFNVVGLPIHRLACLWRESFGENFL
ncbi:MAG: septum formation protein Maf [Ruminococcaceae bacterium]|nr:septum formation protein Maf [Oscillospiraceae bacterium]